MERKLNNMEIKIPKGWRKGQVIFNFLEWLKDKKGIPGRHRMADPFYIEDGDFDKYLEEYEKRTKI